MAPPKGFKKPEGSGMKKGQATKRTMLLKDMILNALDQAGGPEYLVKQSKDNPVAFMTLVGKVLPMQVTGADDGAIQVVATITRRIVDPANNGA